MMLIGHPKNKRQVFEALSFCPTAGKIGLNASRAVKIIRTEFGVDISAETARNETLDELVSDVILELKPENLRF